MPPSPVPNPTPGDRHRIEHMLRTARDAGVILGDLDAAALSADMIRTRALVNCVTEIGEAAGRLSPGALALVGDLPWRQIVGMRNTVVHVCWGISLVEVVTTVRTDLPPFIAALEAALTAWPKIQE